MGTALLVLLEACGHLLSKIFGPRLSAEEKRKLAEKQRREARRSIAIGATIVGLFVIFLWVALRWVRQD